MTGRLDGRVAIVTGAASGMGAATAALFVDEGATVVLTDVDETGGAAHASTLGERAHFHRLDVGDADAWRDLVASVDATHGGVDALVNNAGVSLADPLDALSLDDFDTMVRVNQRGVLLGMRAVLAPMRRAGRGSIVNIASGAALRGEIGLTGYSGTKFAVRGMIQVAAKELAADGIRVNVVHPGCIDTPMHQLNPADRQAALIERIPLRRFGTPVEVAQMVLFLTSDDASYITGSDFAVDGGILL